MGWSNLSSMTGTPICGFLIRTGGGLLDILCIWWRCGDKQCLNCGTSIYQLYGDKCDVLLWPYDASMKWFIKPTYHDDKDMFDYLWKLCHLSINLTRSGAVSVIKVTYTDQGYFYDQNQTTIDTAGAAMLLTLADGNLAPGLKWCQDIVIILVTLWLFLGNHKLWFWN